MSSPDGVSIVPWPDPGANSRGNHMRRMAAMVSLDSRRSPKRGVLDLKSANSFAIARSFQPWAASSPMRTNAGKFTGSTRTGIRGGLHVEGAPSGEAQPTRDLAARAVGAGLTPARALHLLAAFSFYAGIGQKTAMGMGQARPLPHPSAAVPIGERTLAVTPGLRVAGTTADAARA